MASVRRKCLNYPDEFCYICGRYILIKQRENITEFIKKAYHAYFDVHLGDQDKSWAPHTVCNTCKRTLTYWTEGKRSFSFGVPMVWREPTNHADDCYFCIVKTAGHHTKTLKNIQYPNVNSAIRPVAHSDEIPVPVFKGFKSNIEVEDTDQNQPQISNEDNDDDFDDQYQPFNQLELNDLVRDLSLSKEQSELLGSRLLEKHLLESGTKVSFYRNREKVLLQYFAEHLDSNGGKLVFCRDIAGLLVTMGVPTYDANDWRLFIDSSKRSLKCVLLHIGNKYGAIPIGHSVNMKEKYEEIKKVLELINYNEHNWVICVDLKMVNFLLGQQSGYTKYPCFLCF